jgi:hypothetical protein
MDQAIRLYRRNFVAFVGIVALVEIPIIAVQFLVTLTLVNTDPGSNSIGGLLSLNTLLTFFLSFFLVQGLGTAAMTRAVSDNYLGEKTGSLQAFRKIGRSWLSLIGALITAGGVGLVIFIWALVPIVGWLTGWAMFIFLAVIVVPFVAPVIVLESHGAIGAWRRAWDLARQRFWWIVGFFFVLTIFNWLVVIGPTLLLDFVIAVTLLESINDPASATIAQTVVTSLNSLLFNLIYLPFQLAAITLVYFDLRVRSEAFDLVLLAQDTGDSELKVADVTAAAPQAQKRSLLTSRELGYFAALTLLFAALFFVLFLGFTVLFLILGIA